MTALTEPRVSKRLSTITYDRSLGPRRAPQPCFFGPRLSTFNNPILVMYRRRIHVLNLNLKKQTHRQFVS
jgi:hypothetical protein